MRKVKPVHRGAMYTCAIWAWIVLFLPIPILTYVVATPLLLATVVLAIISLNRNDIFHGVIGIFCVFVISPMVHLVSMGILLSGFNNIFSDNDRTNKNLSLKNNKTIESELSAEKTKNPPSEIHYKYILSFINGTNLIVDDLSLSGDKAIYKNGTIKVTINKDQLRSYKKIAIK